MDNLLKFHRCPISSAFCAEDVGKLDANLVGRINMCVDE
jgi:hypothetical protein